MRVWTIGLAVCLLLSACGGDSDSTGRYDTTSAKQAKAVEVVGVPAVRTKRLNLQACFEEDIGDEAATTSRCPSFVLLSLDFLSTECSAAGGTLQPIEESIAWSLDVDGDASAEIMIDLRQNMDCKGAPGVFSCGSLGCPYFIYGKRGDSWVELGAINADDAPAIEVLPGPAGTPVTLRGGCAGMQPCSEMTYYEWKGSAYERSWIDFRGSPVDVAPDGLWTANRDLKVLASPGPRGVVLDEYPVGTAAVVIGKARDAPYLFVSPCNACRRGFVETAALTR